MGLPLLKPMVGERHGLRTIIDIDIPRAKGQLMVQARCRCGKEDSVNYPHLRIGLKGACCKCAADQRRKARLAARMPHGTIATSITVTMLTSHPVGKIVATIGIAAKIAGYNPWLETMTYTTDTKKLARLSDAEWSELLASVLSVPAPRKIIRIKSATVKVKPTPPKTKRSYQRAEHCAADVIARHVAGDSMYQITRDTGWRKRQSQRCCETTGSNLPALDRTMTERAGP